MGRFTLPPNVPATSRLLVPTGRCSGRGAAPLYKVKPATVPLLAAWVATALLEAAFLVVDALVERRRVVVLVAIVEDSELEMDEADAAKRLALRAAGGLAAAVLRVVAELAADLRRLAAGLDAVALVEVGAEANLAVVLPPAFDAA